MCFADGLPTDENPHEDSPASPPAADCGSSCGTGTPPMPEEEIEQRMPTIPGWTRRGDSLVRTFKFPDRARARLFLAMVGDVEDRVDNHARITSCYCECTLELTTHSAGNKLTEKNFEVARGINSILSAGYRGHGKTVVAAWEG